MSAERWASAAMRCVASAPRPVVGSPMYDRDMLVALTALRRGTMEGVYPGIPVSEDARHGTVATVPRVEVAISGVRCVGDVVPFDLRVATPDTACGSCADVVCPPIGNSGAAHPSCEGVGIGDVVPMSCADEDEDVVSVVSSEEIGYIGSDTDPGLDEVGLPFDVSRLEDVDAIDRATDQVILRCESSAVLGRTVSPLVVLSAVPRSLQIQSLASSITLWVSALFPTLVAVLPPDTIPGAVQSAYDYSAEAKTVQDAVDWGAGYVIPESLLENDRLAFAAAGGCLEMIEARRALSAPNRLSAGRVLRWISADNPEYAHILRLAVSGMPVFRCHTFVPNMGNPGPKLSVATVRVLPALQKMLVEQYCDKQQAVLVSKASVIESGIPFHVSKLSWTAKHGKPQGRPITDCSTGGIGQCALNSEAAKNASDSAWGAIVHPSINRVARMCLDFYAKAKLEDPTVRWSDLRLWKMDLKGAYTLISFMPSDVPLVCVEISPGTLMFFLAGVFGWT
eukprot:gene42143-biopygen7118